MLGKIHREMGAAGGQDVRGRVGELVSIEGTSDWSTFPAARFRGSLGKRYCLLFSF